MPLLSRLLAPLLCALLLTSCTSGDDAAPDEASGASSSKSPAAGEIPAAAGQAQVEAALDTVRSFFNVKGRAEESLGDKIDRQERYLTSRAVHPTAAYEEPWGDQPSGITEDRVSVTLTNARLVGDTVKVDFATEIEGVSYSFVGDEMSETGSPQSSHWSGTATVVAVGGAWLIDELTMDSFGGGTG